VSRKKKRQPTQGTSTQREATADSSYPGWIPPITGLKIITATSLALMAFVGWQSYHQTGDPTTSTRLAVIAGISIWVVFGFVLLMTKLIRSRSAQ